MERLRGPIWGEWSNAFAVGFDNAQRLDLMKFDQKGRLTRSATALQKLGSGFKAVAVGPGGLYVMTSGKREGDEIWQLSLH